MIDVLEKAKMHGKSSFVSGARKRTGPVRIARHAYDDFNAKLRWLWDRSGQSDAFPAHFIPDFDVAMAAGVIGAGSPPTIRNYVARQIAESGITYLATGFAFGKMTLAESRSSMELFAREVMSEFTDVQRVEIPV